MDRAATECAGGEMKTPNGIGERFAQAVRGKDACALEALLAPDIDFQVMSQRRFWEATSAAAVVHDIIFGNWFAATDHIEAERSCRDRHDCGLPPRGIQTSLHQFEAIVCC